MKITYCDIEEAAPRVTLCGVTFKDGVPVEIDAANPSMADLIEIAKANPFFQIDDAVLDPEVVQKVRKSNKKSVAQSDPSEPASPDAGYVDAG